MPTYQYAIGHDNEAGFQDWPLLNTKPPRVGGLRAGVRDIVGDGTTIQDGYQSCTIDYGFLEDDEVETLFTAFQFDPQNGSASTKITVSIPRNIDRDFANYNAVIVAPDFPQNGEFVRGKWGPTQFLLQRLEPT